MRRASQLKGFGYGVHMHTKDATGLGVGSLWQHLAFDWGKAPRHSERARAASAWCEAITLLPGSDIPDDLSEEVQGHFDEDEVVALTLAVVALNGWNRVAAGRWSPAGIAQRPDGHP